MDETVSEIQQQLKQARADFQLTSGEIKRRLAADELRLEHQIKQNPLTSVLAGVGAGFIIGRASRHMAVLLALLTGVVAGYSLADRYRSEQ